MKVVAFDKTADPYIWGITACCFSIFMLEVILGTLCRENYFLTFFFWLDIISTLSMIPDIGWIWQLIIGENGNAQTGNAAQLVMTTRAGRVTRVIRVIRLIRLIRIVKLYKQAKMAEKLRLD